MIHAMAFAPTASGFAEVMNAIANLARVLVWPLLVGIFLTIWRKEIGEILDQLPRLLQGLKSAKVGPVEAVWVFPAEKVGEVVVALQEDAERSPRRTLLPDRPSPPLTPPVERTKL
jgi:hypothetical protein